MADFSFSARQPDISTRVIDGIKAQVRASCQSVDVPDACPGLERGRSCPCYAEFAARYWLRLGSFPVFCCDFEAVQVAFSGPEQADSFDRFVTNPELALTGAWSSLITGPKGSGRTSLAAFMSKSIMKWELVHGYSSTTRAVYFTARDYMLWLRKLDDYKRTQAEVDYYEGALLGSVFVWDEIDPQFANEARFVADVKKRIEQRLPVHLILSQDAGLYAGSRLFEMLGVSLEPVEKSANTRRIGSIRANGFVNLALTGIVMPKTGWT